jgi:hypothetical protein
MPLTFEQAHKLFQQDKIRELATDANGLRFIKLRSLSRKEILLRLFEENDLDLPDAGGKALFKAAFESPLTLRRIDTFIRHTYQQERVARREREADLINELYQMQNFDWGGLHQNSLEKTIIDVYVKRITQYDELCERIENELQRSLRGYVLCSWYNHWTSIIIEDIFRDHPTVLPAVGLVKKIDFFIRDIPFDLKVTYLPEGFVSDSRKDANERPELTLLKRAARQFGIPINADLPSNRLLEDLWQKVQDHPDADCRTLIRELRDFRNDVVTDIHDHPERLIKWLYEQQGVRRFDASNRLFLVLVDKRNYFESWKLKRAKPLLEAQIRAHLNNIGRVPGREVEFTWEDGNTYTVRADLVLITHDEA